MTNYTWAGGASGFFSLNTNWSPQGVPNSSSVTTLLAGSTVTLTGNVSLSSILVTGAGTTTLGNAAFHITVGGGVTLLTGQTLNLATASLTADHLTLSGTGTYGFSNGTMSLGQDQTISTGKTFELTNVTFTSSHSIDGAGTVSLHGTTMNFTNTHPTVNINFETVNEGDTFNHLNLPAAGGDPLGNISNLGYGTTISANGANLALTLVSPGVYHLVTVPGGVVISNHVTLAPGTNIADFTNSGGSFIYNGPAPCFCAGTRILTDRGEVLIEDLQIGDLIVTASGAARPVRWLGHSVLNSQDRGRPEVIWPVRVAKGAFGEGLPVRDLWVSPGHCIAHNGVLVPINVLANGRTIVQHERKTVEYWHVELDRHDVILAEGLPVESYLDTGNRVAFANGREARALHPEFEVRHWSETCLPYVASGPAVEKAKAALLARAEALGHSVTREPDLHVVAGGRRVDSVRLGEKRYLFVLPPDCRSATLRSRAFVPADMDPASGDRRLLASALPGCRSTATISRSTPHWGKAGTASTAMELA